MRDTNVVNQTQPIEPGASEVISAAAPTVTLCCYGNRLTREELVQVKTPVGTPTHKTIPHGVVVEKLIEALQLPPHWRSAGEYAVSSDGVKMFGVMDLSSGFD